MTLVSDASIDPRDVDYTRRVLAKKLGLDLPVPLPVLLRVSRDPVYRDRLLACGRDARCLDPLLAAVEETAGPPASGGEPSSRELVAEALSAFWRWAGDGFGLVDAPTYRRRMDACRQCPHYGPVPDRLLYTLSRLWAADSGICRKCGCVMGAKTRLAKEACPIPDPEDPTRNRWGERHD